VLGNKKFEFVVSEVTRQRKQGVQLLGDMSCAPEVMVPDARVFISVKNEQKYPWLYDSGTPRVFM
jgi:hypothetical protein